MPSVSRLKAIPWAMALQAGLVAREHWRKLTEKERSRLLELLGKARGRPGNLTAREREELKRLARKLDVPGFGRNLLPLGRAARGKK